MVIQHQPVPKPSSNPDTRTLSGMPQQNVATG